MLFNNERCAAVAPGTVEKIMQKITPVAEYKRHGGLYLADVVMGPLPMGFHREGREE